MWAGSWFLKKFFRCRCVFVLRSVLVWARAGNLGVCWDVLPICVFNRFAFFSPNLSILLSRWILLTSTSSSLVCKFFLVQMCSLCAFYFGVGSYLDLGVWIFWRSCVVFSVALLMCPCSRSKGSSISLSCVAPPFAVRLLRRSSATAALWWIVLSCTL